MARNRDAGYVSGYPVVVAYAETYGTATGGTSSTITVGGESYTLLTFASDANLTVTKAGLFDLLLIGGGGAGGYGSSSGTGGGAGGGGGDIVGLDTVITTYLAAGTYSVDIGAGGAANTGLPGLGNGNPSTLAGFISIGGGGGGMFVNRTDDTAFTRVGMSGGSAGGSCAIYDSKLTYKLGIKGNNGGAGDANINTAGSGGGGGGGAGSAGQSHPAGSTGGAGGNGADISGWIAGSTYYASAGGGASSTGTGGAAGLGGVAGLSSNGVGNSGVNYGAGGGGGRGANNGGAGAAGAVFVRFKV
jgi:hypothetical protein